VDKVTTEVAIVIKRPQNNKISLSMFGCYWASPSRGEKAKFLALVHGGAATSGPSYCTTSTGTVNSEANHNLLTLVYRKR